MYSSSQPNRNLHQVGSYSLITWNSDAIVSHSPTPCRCVYIPIICKQAHHRVSSSVRPTPASSSVNNAQTSASVLLSGGLSSSTGTTQGAHAGRRQGQDVLLTGGVLSKAGVVANDAAGGLVGVEGHGQRLGCDKPADAFRARGSSKRSGVAVRGELA